MKLFFSAVVIGVVVLLSLPLVSGIFGVALGIVGGLLGILAGLFGVVVGLAAAALALAIALSPIWLLVLAIIGLVSLLKRGARRTTY